MSYPPSTGNSWSFAQAQAFTDPQFDIFEWHVKHQSCLRYFLDHAQHTGSVQSLTCLLNIQLPFQNRRSPVISSTLSTPPPPPPGGVAGPSRQQVGALPPLQLPTLPPGTPALAAAAAAAVAPPGFVTLVPYLRRLVATGFDLPAILHSFFGDDWRAGIGPLHETERRNYLFAAKSENWLEVKSAYDMDDNQTVPFLRPLQGVTESEIANAESRWSEWLAMQDWMLGPRAPENMVGGRGGRGVGDGDGGATVKREEDEDM